VLVDAAVPHSGINLVCAKGGMIDFLLFRNGHMSIMLDEARRFCCNARLHGWLPLQASKAYLQALRFG